MEKKEYIAEKNGKKLMTFYTEQPMIKMVEVDGVCPIDHNIRCEHSKFLASDDKQEVGYVCRNADCINNFNYGRNDNE